MLKQKAVMLSRSELIEIVKAALADVLGVYETDVAIEASILGDLGVDEEDFEEIAAQLQQAIEQPVLTSDIFGDDDITVDGIVDNLAASIAEGH